MAVMNGKNTQKFLLSLAAHKLLYRQITFEQPTVFA